MLVRRLLGGSLAILVVLAGPGCRGEGQGGESRSLPPAEATRQVSDLLYRRNLIADPEVNAKMNEYVLQVSRDGRSADSVMPDFHRWLSQWAHEHADRVAAARLAPGAATPVVVPQRTRPP
jgi:hypothetical protein